MTGRSRLPGGEPRQGQSAQQARCRIAAGQDYTGSPYWRPSTLERLHRNCRRDVGDGEHSEIVIEGRIYRVRISEIGQRGSTERNRTDIMPRYTIFLLAQPDGRSGAIGIFEREERQFSSEAEAIQRGREMYRSHQSTAIGFQVYDDGGNSIYVWTR